MVYLLSQTIDRAAERAEHADAFRSEDRRLTYGEIVDRANRLANLLVEEGVRRGDRVGIFMPRCLESAIAVYGIMKAGAAFVPLDPAMPSGGLEHLIDACGIGHLTTHPSQAQALSSLTDGGTSLRSVIGLDSPSSPAVRTCSWSSLSQVPADPPPQIRLVEDDLAYIMFSSGSTGRPKGIMHTHRSGLAYATLSVDTYGVRCDDCIGNHSPLHFDMSTFGYFSSPLAGATTVLIPEAYTKLTASLSRLIETERMTIWYSVPLALIQLLTRGVLESRDLSPLRWVLFGGEPFPVKHLRALMRQWPHARFSNVYGPAEVNQCTYYHLPPLEDGAEAGEGAGEGTDTEVIPIGKVWDNAEGLVLDEQDEPVEVGGVGELLIHSPTMMRGYWARPDQNDRVFYRQRRQENLVRTFYRTGDLVRIREDGNLLFLGRKDRQIKVRGYRVELDDIEHMLTTHGDIEEAAVFPVRVVDEIDHLEAAVIPRNGVQPDPQALKSFLSDLLSSYAVPSTIEVVRSLPRTTSGKIDRRQLQAHAEAGKENR